ncbi:short-chain-enoyl-CoA hydratase-like [Frieseomelitta varia]|uniref:short-chain-enoyl-CoA hydratase-like n=1 Tax=Frieseomelitta varia TaxID=561572 RepID=UPI001CB69607|nr:short-chain-enoyl-CoA hydratase-like [Frieseomelitta varia]XP_043527757.1 short-chain-enoyl-CoA hydratase-like [Frieseomelitta varia]
MHFLKRLSRIIDLHYKHHSRRCLTSNSNTGVKIEAEQDISEKNILVEHFEAITLIGINRPESKNALNVATAQKLSDKLDEFENDENSVVGILYGTGGNFCSGYDLKEIAQYNGKNEEVLPQFGSLANKIELCKKPLIAAINGYALGIGFELALMCDLRVMEKGAVLGFANRRFGIPILCGGTVRLPALIGYSRAIELILTGRYIDAKEAHSCGLINRLTETGSVLGIAVNFANSLVKFPRKTLLADRASAYFATFSAKQLEEAVQFEKDNASHLVFEEGVAGAKRFVTEGLGKHGKFYNITERKTKFKELDKEFL